MITPIKYNDFLHVTYSHSDYTDILQIHADYISHKKNKTLIIDTDDIPHSIKDVYDRIIYYDDTLPYASRILNSVKQIDDERFLLMHDTDILLRVDSDKMEQLLHLCTKHGMDRLDLQVGLDPSLFIDRLVNGVFYTAESIKKKTAYVTVDDECKLIKQVYFRNHPLMGSSYLYNVNPSIWNKQSLLRIMEQFSHLDYRSIERDVVQKFCDDLSIYKIGIDNFISCGHFDCADFFTFFHITCQGKLVPFDNDHRDKYGCSYESVAPQYQQIINKYKLFNSERRSS